MQRDNRRLGSFPIGWVRPSRCTGWVKSPGYNLPPWTTPSKAGPETGREPNRPREGTPARPAAGPPGGRARGMEDGESRMENRGWSARFARWTVSRESYIVSRGAVGTRASAPVSAPPPHSPRLAVSSSLRLPVSPSPRFPISSGLDLVVSSSHRLLGTNHNKAAFPPSRAPPPPQHHQPSPSPLPVLLPLEKGREDGRLDSGERSAPPLAPPRRRPGRCSRPRPPADRHGGPPRVHRPAGVGGWVAWMVGIRFERRKDVWE